MIQSRHCVERSGTTTPGRRAPGGGGVPWEDGHDTVTRPGIYTLNEAYTVHNEEGRNVHGLRTTLYIGAAYMVLPTWYTRNGLHGLFGYIFTAYIQILQTTR